MLGVIGIVLIAFTKWIWREGIYAVGNVLEFQVAEIKGGDIQDGVPHAQ